MKKALSLFIAVIVMSLGITFAAFSSSENLFEKIELNSKNTVITLSSSKYYYNGNEKKPSVTVVYTDENKEKTTLTSKKDYTVSYSNNKAVGVAKITVSGKGSFTGTITAKYAIVSGKITNVKTASRALNSLNVTWKAQKGVSGYYVQYSKTGVKNYKNIFVSASKTSVTIKNLKVDTDYKIYVRSYIKIGKTYYYSKLSDKLSTSTKAVVSAPKCSGYCSLISIPTLTWKTVSGAEKYNIYRASSKNGTYSRIASLTGTSYSDKSAALHKTYYYKVRSFKTVDGVLYKSRESNTVKIKAMKTVLVGDSIMEGIQYYKVLPGGTFVVKVGMGTYTFYNSYYFKINGKSATGLEKLLSYKPDRVFMMFGMNEAAYKKNASIIQYYQYAVEDIKDERPGCQIIILPVSPTTAGSRKSIPKRDRINSLNSELKKFAEKNKCKYYNFTSPFKDSNGYLLKKYNGGDGCHWNIAGCRLFVSQLNKYIKTH